MTEKRLFVGRKKCEDRFTIIKDYEGEIGVKENRSGDVIVLKHSDLNAQQFVAQLVVFLNDQNQAIVDLYDGNRYWFDKATERIEELEKENKQLKTENENLKSNVDDLMNMELEDRDIVCQAGKFRLEEWGKYRLHQFYDGDTPLEDETVVIRLLDLTKENEQLKSENQRLEKLIEELNYELTEIKQSEEDNYNITDGLW